MTRLFRVACQEHPGLPPIALKSLELWTGLGDQIGERLVHQSGCLSTGSPRGRAVSGVIAAAAAAGLPVQQLSHDELAARQPQYAGLAPGDVAAWDPGAGICYPERNVRAHTPTVEFRASQVVVAAGAWLGTLLPGLPLAPRRTPQYWFRPRDPRSGEFRLPCRFRG